MIFLCFKINMLKKEEGGRRDTAKAEKNEKLFFQKYYIFLLILHINRERKICSRYKSRLWVKCSKVTNPAKPESYLVPSRYGKASSRAAKMPHKTGGISAIHNQIASDTRFAGYLFGALLLIETPPILRKLCN